MTSPVQLAEHYKEHVDSIIDTTFYTLINREEDDDWVDQIYPMVEIPEWEYTQAMMDNVMPIAHVIGVDGELPSVRNQIDFTSFTEQYSKLGYQHIWDEAKLRTLGKALQNAERRNSQSAMAQALDMFFILPQQKLINGLVNTGRYLSLQQIFTLQVEYQDPRTRVRVSLDHRELAPQTLWPSPLTGAEDWSNYPTANGLRDLESHFDAWFAINGDYPQEVRMSRSLMRHLLNQESTIERIGQALNVSNVNLGVSNSLVQRASLLNDILQTRPLDNGQAYPMLKTYERQFAIQTDNNTIQIVDGVPKDRYALISARERQAITTNGTETKRVMGTGFWGPTIESGISSLDASTLDPMAIINQSKSGPHVATELVNRSTFATYAVGNFVPMPYDIRSFGGRKVIEAAA